MTGCGISLIREGVPLGAVRIIVRGGTPMFNSFFISKGFAIKFI
jgi:hypothetical protein